VFDCDQKRQSPAHFRGDPETSWRSCRSAKPARTCSEQEQKKSMMRKFIPPFGVAPRLACNKGNRDNNDRHGGNNHHQLSQAWPSTRPLGLAPVLRRCLVRFG
jgi:hypothetical protein